MLRAVEADIVQLTPVVSLRQFFLIIECDPPAPLRLLLRRQQRLAFTLFAARPGELGGYDRADADGRGEIVAVIAELDMVASKSGGRSHERLDGLALVPHLPGGFRIGGDRLIHVGHVVEGL